MPDCVTHSHCLLWWCMHYFLIANEGVQILASTVLPAMHKAIYHITTGIVVIRHTSCAQSLNPDKFICETCSMPLEHGTTSSPSTRWCEEHASLKWTRTQTFIKWSSLCEPTPTFPTLAAGCCYCLVEKLTLKNKNALHAWLVWSSLSPPACVAAQCSHHRPQSHIYSYQANVN